MDWKFSLILFLQWTWKKFRKHIAWFWNSCELRNSNLKKWINGSGFEFHYLKIEKIGHAFEFFEGRFGFLISQEILKTFVYHGCAKNFVWNFFKCTVYYIGLPIINILPILQIWAYLFIRRDVIKPKSAKAQFLCTT